MPGAQRRALSLVSGRVHGRRASLALQLASGASRTHSAQRARRVPSWRVGQGERRAAKATPEMWKEMLVLHAHLRSARKTLGQESGWLVRVAPCSDMAAALWGRSWCLLII